MSDITDFDKFDDDITPEEQAELDRLNEEFPSMSHWNNRVIRVYNEFLESFSYEIHEVYYDTAGNPVSWTENATSLTGEDVYSLKVQLTRMLECCDRPVLTLTKVDGEEKLI